MATQGGLIINPTATQGTSASTGMAMQQENARQTMDLQNRKGQQDMNMAAFQQQGAMDMQRQLAATQERMEYVKGKIQSDLDAKGQIYRKEIMDYTKALNDAIRDKNTLRFEYLQDKLEQRQSRLADLDMVRRLSMYKYYMDMLDKNGTPTGGDKGVAFDKFMDKIESWIKVNDVTLKSFDLESGQTGQSSEPVEYSGEKLKTMPMISGDNPVAWQGSIAKMQNDLKAMAANKDYETTEEYKTWRENALRGMSKLGPQWAGFLNNVREQEIFKPVLEARRNGLAPEKAMQMLKGILKEEASKFIQSGGLEVPPELKVLQTQMYDLGTSEPQYKSIIHPFETPEHREWSKKVGEVYSKLARIREDYEANRRSSYTPERAMELINDMALIGGNK